MDLNNPREWEEMETQQQESAEALENYRRFTPVDERTDLYRTFDVSASFDEWADQIEMSEQDRGLAWLAFNAGVRRYEIHQIQNIKIT